MKESDVVAYLKAKGIKETDLTGKAKEALELYQAVKDIYETDKSDKTVKAEFIETSKTAILIIEATLKNKQKSTAVRNKVAAKKSGERKKSIEVVELSLKEIEGLKKSCQRLREVRKSKIESGEIKPPKKKTRVTKVKDYLRRILKLMPSEDVKDIEASELALRKCARELFKINGLNRIDSVEKELKETADDLAPKEQAKDKKAA